MNLFSIASIPVIMWLQLWPFIQMIHVSPRSAQCKALQFSLGNIDYGYMIPSANIHFPALVYQIENHHQPISCLRKKLLETQLRVSSQHPIILHPIRFKKEIYY